MKETWEKHQNIKQIRNKYENNAKQTCPWL